MIEIKEIEFSYGEYKVLKGLDYSLKKGRFLSILGPNGSGKSTLLKTMTGLLEADRGTIRIKDRDIADYTSKELAKVQAYVAQRDEANFGIRVGDAVLLGRKPYINWNYRKEDYELVHTIMKFMGIDHMKDKKLAELSGGERQRVMIARALAQDPEILLLDEPTSALDIKHQIYVMELLRFLCDEMGYTIVIVMHDLNLAYNYSDEILLLNEGEIFSSGESHKVLSLENIREVYKVEAEKLNSKKGGVFAF